MLGYTLSICANGVWTALKSSYPTYHDAVRHGQSIAPRAFTVACPTDRAPTREEQLLLAPRPRVYRNGSGRGVKFDRWLEQL